MLPLLAVQDYINVIFQADPMQVLIERMVTWAYYIGRNWLQYGSADIKTVLDVTILIYVQSVACELNRNYYQRLDEQKKVRKIPRLIIIQKTERTF